MGVDTVLQWLFKAMLVVIVVAIVATIVTTVTAFVGSLVLPIAAQAKVIVQREFLGLPFLTVEWDFNLASWFKWVSVWSVGVFLLMLAWQYQKFIIKLFTGGGS